MKILLVSPKGDGGWYVWLLKKEGHDVDWYIHDERYRGTFDGIVKAPLKNLPNPSKYDLVVFDTDGMGDAADEARILTPTVGSSALADRLEEDRLFGLEIMEAAGIRVPEWEVFDSPEKGIAWLQKNHKRTVFKPIGADIEDKSTTYVSQGESDMIAFMERVFKRAKISSFILQEVVPGHITETAAGGWFNGHDWLVVDHNIEEKKLMPGNIGPNTGCAGMLMWLPPRPTPLFQQGLEKITDYLRKENYVGPLDLNTIVTEGTAYGIEWTPRFGYEGTCNLTRLLPVPFAELLGAAARGEPLTMPQSDRKFCASIRMSVPPYPTLGEDMRKLNSVPVLGVDLKHLEGIFLADVRKSEAEGELETTGAYNSVGAPLGLGDTIDEAFAESEGHIKRLKIPDVMWRNDVCKCIKEKYFTLERQGWLRPLG